MNRRHFAPRKKGDPRMSETSARDAATGTARPAGSWLRVAAYIVYVILISIVGWLIATVFGVGLVMDASGQAEMGSAFVGMQVAMASVWCIYLAGLESSKFQATLGKLVVGVRVTDGAGGRLSFGRALGRALAKYLSAVILLIGFIMVAFTDRKRGLHDMIAGTLVAYR